MMAHCVQFCRRKVRNEFSFLPKLPLTLSRLRLRVDDFIRLGGCEARFCVAEDL